MRDNQIQQLLEYPGDIAELRDTVENICEQVFEDYASLEDLIDRDLVGVQQDVAGDWYVAVYNQMGEVIGFEYLENEQE